METLMLDPLRLAWICPAYVHPLCFWNYPFLLFCLSPKLIFCCVLLLAPAMPSVKLVCVTYLVLFASLILRILRKRGVWYQSETKKQKLLELVDFLPSFRISSCVKTIDTTTTLGAGSDLGKNWCYNGSFQNLDYSEDPKTRHVRMWNGRPCPDLK